MLSTSYIRAGVLSALLAIGAQAAPHNVKRADFEPAMDMDFPDPSIMKAGDGFYYAYATAGNGAQVQVAKSPNGYDWEYQHNTDALKSGSVKWAPADPSVWAVDVTPGPDGVYWMYFSAVAKPSKNSEKHCIGFATSMDPMGPFEPNSDEPWVCDSETGDIDPDQFLDDDGTRWVTWKVDGNSEGRDTPIMLQQVNADDGYTKIGDAKEILNRDEIDGPLIEAPSLFKMDGIYFLSFSSNMYDNCDYAGSFATSKSVTGPYKKAQHPNAPILTKNTEGLCGPGGADMIVVPNSVNIMVFHGWNAEKTKRYMYATAADLSYGLIKLFRGDHFSKA